MPSPAIAFECYDGELPPIPAKYSSHGRCINISDGMNVGRPSKISASAGWMAVILIVVWLAGISTSFASHSSCCKPQAANRAGSPGCCENNAPCDRFNGCEPSAPQEVPSPTAVWPNDPLAGVPPKNLSSAWRSAPPTADAESLSRNAIEPSIPAELRLGSALWGHAPPTHVP